MEQFQYLPAARQTPAFADTFTSQLLPPLPIAEIWVDIWSVDVLHDKSVDILPLLLVKAHARNFTWHVGRHFTLNLYTRGFGLQGVGNTLRKILEEAPRRLLGDVRSGVFSELCLRRIVYSPPDWSSWDGASSYARRKEG